MEKIFALLGIAIFIGIAYLFSTDKKAIKWNSVGLAFMIQFVLAFLLIKTPLWKGVEFLSTAFIWVINQASTGIDFVFGGISENFVFFINSLLPIVFISALMGILFHFNILQNFISFVGKVIAKTLKIDTLVAVNGVANMFLGQSESLFVTKSYLSQVNDHVIFATLVGGMSSISASVVGLYLGFGASMEWIIISIPLTVFSAFTLTQIIMPTEYCHDEIEIQNDKGVNFIETMMNYGMSGFNSVIGISVALMVFLSLVGMINGLLGFIIPNFTIEKILGFFFYPFSLMMGVPTEELGMVSQLLASKLVLNEAIAFGMPQFAMLSSSTKAMITVTLCGFAGFGSVGILIGTYSAIAPKKVGVVAKLGMKALLVSTVVNLLTGAIVGLML